MTRHADGGGGRCQPTCWDGGISTTWKEGIIGALPVLFPRGVPCSLSLVPLPFDSLLYDGLAILV
jgi:hypothetical protein